MRKAGAVVSLIGGVLGVLLAFVTLAFGGIASAFGADKASSVVGLGWGGVFFSIMVIVFAAFAFAKPRFSGWALIACSILGALLGGTLVAIVMLLSLVGGILCVVGSSGETIGTVLPPRSDSVTPAQLTYPELDAPPQPASPIAATHARPLVAAWSTKLLVALGLGTLLFPPVGLVAGVYGLTQPQNRSRGGGLLAFSVAYMSLFAVLMGGKPKENRDPPAAGSKAPTASVANASSSSPRQSRRQDALPAAPYSQQANDRLRFAEYSVAVSPSGGDATQQLKQVMDALDEVFRKAGYSLQKSLVVYIDEAKQLGHVPLVGPSEFAKQAYVLMAGASEQHIPLASLFENPSPELVQRFSHFPNQKPQGSPATVANPQQDRAELDRIALAQRSLDDRCKRIGADAVHEKECIARKEAQAADALETEYQRLLAGFTPSERPIFQLRQLEWHEEMKKLCLKGREGIRRGTLQDDELRDCYATAMLERATYLARYKL